MTAAAPAIQPVEVKPSFNSRRLSLKPFPAEELPLLWDWLNEFPKANLDDYGPRDLGEFRAFMLQRAQAGIKTIGVSLDGSTVGAVGIMQLDRTSMFRGICFSKAVHGKGIAHQAVEVILLAHWDEGYRKIAAEYMADNRRVRLFLQKLGAVDEGFLKHETMRGGRPMHVRRVAFFPPKKERD